MPTSTSNAAHTFVMVMHLDPTQSSTVSTAQPLVLVVDDEPALQETIAYSLRREGWRVEIARDGVEAIRLNRDLAPDVIVLDVMLPGMDGIQVCRTIRARSNVPILFLSARSEDVDRILGLEIGGDDYLTKPFVMRELVARVRANLRRAQRQPPTAPLMPEQAAYPGLDISRLGPIELDPSAHVVKVGGEPISLKPKEFDLLRYLLDHPNITISRESLLRHVWKYEHAVDTRTVDVHVRGLRQKIEPDPANPVYLVTIRGYGYRMTTEQDSRG